MQRLEEIEVMIGKYQDKLQQVEDDQLRALSADDTVGYKKFQRKRKLYEEIIQGLIDEWDYLERI